MDYDSHRHLPSVYKRFFEVVLLCLFLLVATIPPAHAKITTPPSTTQLSIWTNEAIITAYTFNFSNFLERQKEIATYFSSQGWINFSKALNTAKLRDAVQKNSYDVSAVATLPPDITAIGVGQWKATMPIIVLYKNKSYQQKQILSVTIEFSSTKNGEGVRNLAISSFNSTITTPACRCEKEHATKTIV